MTDLTGRTQYRTHVVGGVFRQQPLLVLQVEYRNGDSDASPAATLWRDATSEDLAHLAARPVSAVEIDSIGYILVAADVLTESAKQHRSRGDTGHASACDHAAQALRTRDGTAPGSRRFSREQVLEAARNMPAPPADGAPSEPHQIAQGSREAKPYTPAMIASELERTALGDAYHGNALRVAKDLPGVTAEDRALLDRYAIGRNRGTDHVALQDLALRIARVPAAMQEQADVDAVRTAADALLTKLHQEYPEKLPFYCRDAAERLQDALDADEALRHPVADQLRVHGDPRAEAPSGAVEERDVDRAEVPRG